MNAVARLLVALVLAGVVVGCGTDAREEFAEDVRASRDRANAGLAQVTEAREFEELVARLRTAAGEVRAAGEDVREAEAPDDLRENRDQLADAYRALGDELQATADGLKDPALDPFDDRSVIQGLDFRNWNRVQRELRELREEGIEVPPLERHAPPAQPG